MLHNIWLQSFAYNAADDALPVTQHVIDQLYNFASERGVQFAAVILEDRSQIADALFSDKSFPYKNCSGFERSDPGAYLLGGSSHPNAKLHAYFADCIGGWLDSDVLPLLNIPSAAPAEQEE